MIVKIINPGNSKRKHRKGKHRKKKYLRPEKKHNSKIKRRLKLMAAKRKYRKRYHHKKRNPVHHKKRRVYHFSNKKHGRHRKHRNPDTMGSTGLTLKKVAFGAGGAVLGGASYHVINGLFQPEGNGKYLIGLGNAALGYWLISKFDRLAGITYAAGVLAVMGYDYLNESGILQGMLGLVYPQPDYLLGNMYPRYEELGLVAPNANSIPITSNANIAFAGSGGDKL